MGAAARVLCFGYFKFGVGLDAAERTYCVGYIKFGVGGTPQSGAFDSSEMVSRPIHGIRRRWDIRQNAGGNTL